MLSFRNVGLLLGICLTQLQESFLIYSEAVETNLTKASPPSPLPICIEQEAEMKNPACGTIEYLGCTGNKKFYHESAIKMTWFESWEYCRSLGLHLASIESRHEQIFVEIFLPPLEATSTESFWTSGTDLGREGRFSWMSNGRDVTFTNFRPGEPNNRFGNEHCIEISIRPGATGYQWNDRNCLGRAFTLCQEDARFPNHFQEAVAEKKE